MSRSIFHTFASDEHRARFCFITFFIYRTPVSLKNCKPPILNTSEIKKEVEDIEYAEVKTELSSSVNEDVLAETEEEVESECKKELDLDNIDMMQLPIQLDDGIDILDDVK